MEIERDIFISVETTDEEAARRFVEMPEAIVEEDLEAKPSKPGLKVFNVFRNQPNTTTLGAVAESKKEGE